MKIGIFNAETNEQIVRDATPEEIAAREAEIAQYFANKKTQELAEIELRATKITAYQKLGLTEAEIEALLPLPAKPRINP
jgi:hypothetical protein